MEDITSALSNDLDNASVAWIARLMCMGELVVIVDSI
jgi:hypothetical protein